jgi:carbonic anhydrase/acetyltransferase-like protein (isoleucine patch superfamily)
MSVESGSLVSIGAILLNGVVVGSGSFVGAGALCLEGMIIPPGSLVLGSPARVRGGDSADLRERIVRTAANYGAPGGVSAREHRAHE